MTGPRGSAPSWATYRETIGDRSGLVGALRAAWEPATALYPGSYLDLAPSTAIPGFDLLISLYAGPVWEHCRQDLSPQGWLLANTSHGDASLAALDPTLRLAGVVHQREGRYRLATEDLGGYLVPRRPAAADAETIRREGRGIAYTRTAFAYVFRPVGEAG